jgi:nitroreductase
MHPFKAFRRAARFIRIFNGDFSTVRKGQNTGDSILQTAHRIEKGLTIQNPRPHWGWNKIAFLVALLEKELAAQTPDRFAVETGASVLKAYIAAKSKSEDKEEAAKAGNLLAGHPAVCHVVETVSVPGGALRLRPGDVSLPGGADWVRQLFSTRHSIRDFSERPIPRELLLQAAQLALFCPSACNRQPSKVYVLEGKKREEGGYENIYHADKYLVVTGKINAFSTSEYGDWLVSATIFATYLALALHALGIGTCMMKKDLHFGSKYNEFLRKACHIPKNEKIVLEIAVGYCKDAFSVACSNRKNAQDVVVFP